MLKKWGNLEKDWDPFSIESIVNFSMRPDKVKKLIELISRNEEVQDIVKTIHYQDIFPFTYNVRKTTNIDANYPNSSHDVNNFKNGSKVIVEFQIVSQNFKASKKIDAVKVFSFQLLGVYLIDNPIQTIVSIPKKRWWGEDEWMVMPLCTKKTITSINLLEA